MNCPKCGGAMRRGAVPYLTADPGSTAEPIDTGMVVRVDLCPSCHFAIVPVGERPFFPAVRREVQVAGKWDVVGPAAKAEDFN